MLLNVPAVCLLDFTCDASIVTAQRRDQWSPALTAVRSFSNHSLNLIIGRS